VEGRWEGRIPLSTYLTGDDDALREGRRIARSGILNDRSVSIGIGVRPTEEFLERCRDLGLPVVRRSSGGSGLLHLPGDLVWSVVLPREDPLIAGGFTRAYRPLGAPLVAALTAHGIEAGWTDPPATSDRFCLFGRRGEVLSFANKVLGGAAQRLARGRLLHHGVVNGPVDRPTIAKVFEVPAEELDERLGGVGESWPEVSIESIGRSLVDRWTRRPAD